MDSPHAPTYSVFEYLYRDAANYKAWGSVLLAGLPTREALERLTASLQDASFFVAEQVGVPVLCGALYDYSGGPTEDDHAWHEFISWRAATQDDIATLQVWGKADDLLWAIQRAKKGGAP